MSRRNSIDISASPPPEQAIEIARLWVEHQGPSFAYINAHVMPDPAMYGMLMADAARHGAKAYAQATGISETEAMARIWEGFDRERSDHSGDLTLSDSGEEAN